LHVNSLRVLGSGSTRTSFLNRLTAGIFQASTLEEVINSVQDASGKLRRLDIFSDIQVILDTAQDTNDAVDVVLKLQEKGKTVIRTTADIANDEANLVRAPVFRCK
jgi:outer membrane protein assembly factor BamA